MTEPRPDDAWVPERIGEYEIVRVIGRGGSGVVFLARQKSPERLVALKLLRPSARTNETVERLKREAEILGRLLHPGVAQNYEAGRFDGDFGDQPYLVMEWVDGPNITDYAKSLEHAERVRLTITTLEAVEHAHGHGVVHRDLKPDKVLADATGNPKLIDFGIARVDDAQSGLTLDGQSLGTLAYMAPEQASGGSDGVGASADVFSIGAIAFEIFAGQSPRLADGLSVTDVLRELAESDAPSARSINKTIDKDLDTILGRALELRPRDRYASAAALRVEFQRYLDHRPISARPPSLIDRCAKFVRRHRALSIGSAATVLALVVGLLATSIQWKRAQSAEQGATVKRYAAEMMFATSLTADPATRGRAQEIVARWRPGSELAQAVDARPQLRWEWHLLKSLEQRDLLTLDLDEFPTAVDWHPDGRRSAVALEGSLAICDAGTGARLQVFPAELLEGWWFFRSVVWDPAGERLAAVGVGGLVLWTPAAEIATRRTP